ncbi:MAG TPA: hypothetical protein VGP63_15235, partial [Planctomycetaceae bacterium]|nr:hypothetical protein [Planctomycetaceae bacterium]
MKGEPSDSRLAEANHAAVALLAAMTALLVAGIGFLSRWGFSDNSPLEWAKYVGLSWFLIHFSVLIRTLIGLPRPGDSGTWWNGHAHLSLAALGLVAAGGILWDGSTGAGMEASVVRHPGAALLALVGILGFLCALFAVVRGQPFRILVALVLFAGCFSLYAAGASWGNGYLNPLFVESLCLGNAHIDTLFHVTMSNMLRSYGVASTGLDGLPFVPYHFGSHWLFAAVSNLLHVRVIDFYNRGYPVVFVPFGMFSLATLALTLGRRFRPAAQTSSLQPADSDTERRELLPCATESLRPIGPLFWFVMAAGFIGLVPYAAGVMPASGWNVNVVSESYGLSVAVSLLTIALGWQFFEGLLTQSPRGIFETAAAIIVLALWVGLIGLLKISIMLVLAAAGLFLIIRLRLYRRASVMALLLCAGISMGCALRLTANPGYAQVNPFLPFGFLRVNVGPQWWPYFWAVFYVWVWVYAAVRISGEGLRTLSDLITALVQRRLLDVEFLIVVALVGAVPGLVTNYSGTLFFSDYQRWLALALVLSLLVRRRHPAAVTRTVGDDSLGQSGATPTSSDRSTMGGLKLGRIACAAVVLCIAGTLCANTLDLLGGMVTANLAARGHASGQTGLGVALMHGRLRAAGEILRQTAAEVESRLRTDKSIIPVLSSLDQMSLAEKRRSLLFIPKSDRQYWDLLHGPYWPKDGPFV